MIVTDLYGCTAASNIADAFGLCHRGRHLRGRGMPQWRVAGHRCPWRQLPAGTNGNIDFTSAPPPTATRSISRTPPRTSCPAFDELVLRRRQTSTADTTPLQTPHPPSGSATTPFF
ncbi:MAG: hypothetical protein IPM82_05910 [Saprospiraceae bacterium]|nr:hypothetical protein [Saprospiraceae bacterium]